MNEPERGNNLHGSLYCSEFEVVEVTGNCVVSRIVNHGEHHPFSFTITFTDTVTEDAYRREAVIKNDGDGNMPYTFALHSTFAEPESFAVPVGKRHEWDENYVPTGKCIPLDEFEKNISTSCIPDGREISAPYSSCGNVAWIGKYKLVVSDNFDYWVFYNGNGSEGYLCVEPQCGAVNCLNTEGGHRILNVGEEELFFFEISNV